MAHRRRRGYTTKRRSTRNSPNRAARQPGGFGRVGRRL